MGSNTELFARRDEIERRSSREMAAGTAAPAFNQLYPLGHAYLGYMDYVGRQNIISPSAGISVSPLFTVLAKAAIAIEVGRSRRQVEPGFPGSALSTEGR